MKDTSIDTQALSTEEYWKLFGRLILSADAGAISAAWAGYCSGSITSPITCFIFIR